MEVTYLWPPLAKRALSSQVRAGEFVDSATGKPELLTGANVVVKGAPRARPHCRFSMVKRGLVTSSRPLHTRFANIFGASVTEAVMRPDPRRALAAVRPRDRGLRRPLQRHHADEQRLQHAVPHDDELPHLQVITRTSHCAWL
jgi:hypothetical protein